MAYTNIDDPSAHFQTLLYTGDSNSPRDLVNDGNSDLQPDFVWVKGRSHADIHLAYDSSRGAGKFLRPATTGAENTGNYGITAFNTDGFRTNAYAYTNENTHTYAAWQWKANGGTTSSNTDGGTTSTVQANTDAGFSIVTWTGTGSATTLGHGLGVAPAVLIVKNRSRALDWAVYHKDLTDAGYVIALNSTDAQVDSGTNRWNHTDPTSSVFSVGSGQQTNQSGDSLIAYCFAKKQGYSKFDKYVGNGSADGPFVHTGFKPVFVMIKRTDSTGGWTIYDTKRGVNGNNYELFPHSDEAEYTGTSYFEADILSNGFKLRLTDGQINASGGTYIYMAFAENPFTTSTGVPCTAR